LRPASLLVAVAIGVGASACGNDDSDEKPGARPVTTVAADATPRLERFLMQAGEMPGFDPIESPGVDSSAESSGYPPDGVERLRRSGFISMTYQPVEAKHNAGVSNVNLFKTEAGARDWMAYETSDEGIHSVVPDTKIQRFTVRGVPGARGWIGTDLHGNRNGHVYWLQGRCMLILGNEGKGSFVEPLSTGAKAIYERTNGTCP
jgi:hypothetical protein